MKRLTVVFMAVAALGLMTRNGRASGSWTEGNRFDPHGARAHGDRPEAGDHVRRVRDNPGEGEHHVHELRVRGRGFWTMAR